MRRLDILLGRGRQIGVREHRAFWKSGRTSGVLKYRHGLTQVGNGMLNILTIVVKELLKRNVLAIFRHRGDFAILRHMSARGLGRRGHFSYVADDEGFQPRCFEQPSHLRVKRLQVERHEHVGLAVVDLVLQNLFRVQRRVVDHGAAGFHHAEERDDIVRRVGQVESDMYAGAHTEFLKSLGRLISEMAQISIRDLLVHEIEGGIIRPLGG